MKLPGRPAAWLRWIVAAGLFFGGIAGIATDAARGSMSAWGAGLQVGLLAATVVAAFWYALVTHRLLLEQQESGEIAEHPWLHVSGWPIGKVLQPDEGRPYSVATASLSIQNVGRTPALLQRVTVTQPDEPGASDWPVTLFGDTSPRALTPGQGFVVDIAEFRLGEGDLPVYVDVSVDYLTMHGGTGRLVLRFRYARGGWKSRETRYEGTLSSGVSLPRGAARSDRL